MRRIHQYLSAVLLGMALIAPIGSRADSKFQEERRHDDDDARQHRSRRYYDRERKDYHHWDDREDARYRRSQEGRHQQYRDFYRLHRRDQSNTGDGGIVIPRTTTGTGITDRGALGKNE